LLYGVAQHGAGHLLVDGAQEGFFGGQVAFADFLPVDFSLSPLEPLGDFAAITAGNPIKRADVC